MVRNEPIFDGLHIILKNYTLKRSLKRSIQYPFLSCGTFCVQIDRLFKWYWIFEDSLKSDILSLWIQKFERPNGKISESKFFLPWSRIGASSSLESSMKRFLRRFDSNQNKSKQMKINDVFLSFYI